MMACLEHKRKYMRVTEAICLCFLSVCPSIFFSFFALGKLYKTYVVQLLPQIFCALVDIYDCVFIHSGTCPCFVKGEIK